MYSKSLTNPLHRSAKIVETVDGQRSIPVADAVPATHVQAPAVWFMEKRTHEPVKKKARVKRYRIVALFGYCYSLYTLHGIHARRNARRGARHSRSHCPLRMTESWHERHTYRVGSRRLFPGLARPFPFTHALFAMPNCHPAQ